jgi:LysM repeat protein
MFARALTLLLVAAIAWAVVARGSNASSRGMMYVVRPADTLWSIAAARYGGDPRAGVWKIEQRNGLAGPSIRPGQHLVLP